MPLRYEQPLLNLRTKKHAEKVGSVVDALELIDPMMDPDWKYRTTSITTHIRVDPKRSPTMTQATIRFRVDLYAK